MRVSVCFLLLAGLICKCTSQNLNRPAGTSPLVGQSPNLPPPPRRASARNNNMGAQNPGSAGSPNQQPTAGPGRGNRQGPTVGGPTGNQQPPQSGTATGNQQNNNAGQSHGVGNSTYQHPRTSPVRNQQPPTAGTGTGNQQPTGPGTATGNQQPAGTGSGAASGSQQPAGPGTATGNQQPAGTGTGAATGSQQPAGPGTATGNQQPAGTGTGAASGNQQPAGSGTATGNQQPQAPSTTTTQVTTTTTQAPTTTTTTQAPTTTTTQAPTSATPKSTIVTTCPATWKKYSGACYQMFTGSDEKNFKNAEDYCRAQKGNLASINDKKEYEYIMKEFMNTLPNAGGITSLWIGLYCKDGKDFFWTDGSDTEGKAFYKPGLMYFKRHHKLATITLSKMGNMNGYFGVPMTKSLPFVCEITLGGKKKNSKEAACGYGWRRFKGRCYRLFNEYERFFAAERQCNQYHGHLVSLNSKKEHKFVRGLFKTKHPVFGAWVGMLHIKHDNARQPTFQWTDGSLTDDYTPPTMFNNLPAPNPNYGVMCKNSSILDVTPYYTLPFICEREMPKGCDPGWDRFQDFCYLASKTPATFGDGMKTCRKLKATLASVCSFNEFKHMMRIRQLFGFQKVLTGARFLKSDKREILIWSDRRGCIYNPPGKYANGLDKFGVLTQSGLTREPGTNKFPVICKKMAKNACENGFKKIYQHDDPLLLVTSASDIKECKKACLEKDGCDGTTFAEYQGNKMCYLHHVDGGQLPMMTSVDLQHWKICRNY